MRTHASCNRFKKLFELCYTKLQFERKPALKFCVTQAKSLVVQLARVRFQTASCVWCAEAFPESDVLLLLLLPTLIPLSGVGTTCFIML
jgi:hypothetical protein